MIDVRELDEFHGELGHVEGAELVPLHELDAHLPSWDRSAPLLVVCRSGKRAAAACDRLVADGFSNVYNLSGGMIAWNADGHARCSCGTGQQRCNAGREATP